MLLPARLRREIVLPALLFALVALAACAPALSPAPAPARAQPTQAAPTPTPVPTSTPTPDPTPTPSMLTAESAEAAFAKQNPDQKPPQVARIIDAAGVWVAVDDAGQAVMYVDEANQWQTPNRLETEAEPVAYRLVQGRLELWNPLTLAFQAMALEGEVQAVTAQGSLVRVELADGTSKLLQFDEKSRQWQELTIYREFEAKELTPDEYQETVNIALAGGKFINTDKEWQELTEGKEDQPGWRVVDDASSHTPVLVSPEAAQMIEAQYGGEFSASPWAEIFAQTRGSMWEGKFKTNSRTPTVAIFDSAGKPALLVSLEKSNPLGKETVAVVLTTAGEVEEIPVPFVTPFRKMFARWDKDLGKLVLTDEFEVRTHWWDQANHKWVEFKRHEAYGDPWESAAHMLHYLVFEDQTDTGSGWFTNVAEIDEAEAKWAIAQLQAHKDVAEINKGLKTFYIAANNEGKPMLIVLRGGKYGLDEKTFQATLKAIRRLNEVDPETDDSPGILEILVNDFGLRMIAGDIPPKTFEENDFRASSNNFKYAMQKNTMQSTSYQGMMVLIPGEGKEIDYAQHMAYKNGKWTVIGGENRGFTDDANASATIFIETWLNQHKKELSQSEIETFQADIRANKQRYWEKN